MASWTDSGKMRFTLREPDSGGVMQHQTKNLTQIDGAELERQCPPWLLISSYSRTPHSLTQQKALF